MSKNWVDHLARGYHKKKSEHYDALMKLADKIYEENPNIDAKEALKRASDLLKDKKNEQK